MVGAMRAAAAAPGPPTRPATGRERLLGIDAARALAFAGMLLAHFAHPLHPDDPGWLQALDGAADGRAAPLFALLLGLGAGLLTARGAADAVVLRRGLVLFAIGVAVWPHVTGVFLILPQYGLLLAVLPLLRRLPTRALLPLAAVAFLAPSVVAATGDDLGLRSDPVPDSYATIADGWWLLRNLLWRGAYPVVGWVGFVAVGLWLARLRLAGTATQLRLLAGGVAVAATQPLVAVLAGAVGRPADPFAATDGGAAGGGLAVFLDGSAHSNHTAWYVLAAASAVAAVAACLLLAGRLRRAVVPAAHLGQLALTAYLAHIALGEVWVWDWIVESRPPLTTQVGLALAVLAACTAVATAWRARFRRGPLEALVRALSG